MSPDEPDRAAADAPTATEQQARPPAPPPPNPDGGAPLPDGTRLHEFLIERVLGEGGFGIVYVARDEQLRRIVALKEYMPSSLSTRQPDQSVQVRSERHRETFDLGLRSFVNEARLLASFDHPSLVKVYRFWEQNGTAYMVMPYYEGPTLRAWLKSQGKPPDEAWLKAMLSPLLDALELIHADHCYHRDIAPDNILLIGPKHRPVLLDFGAARRVIGDATQALTAILKPGYAPIEQYAEMPSLKQGAWTDVYALCAVLHAALSGRPPQPAVARMVKDDYVPLSERFAGQYSPAFLAGIDRGLSVMPDQRPQDIASLRDVLFDDTTLILPRRTAVATGDEATVIVTPTSLESAGLEKTQRLAPTPVAPPPEAPRPSAEEDRTQLATPLQPSPRPPAAPATPVGGPAADAGSKKTLWLAVGAGVLALAGAGAYKAGWVPQAAPAPQPVAEAPAPAAPASAPVAAAAPAPEPAPAPPPAPISRAEFSPNAALDELVAHREPGITVSPMADKSTMVINKDQLRYGFRSSEAGYAYVFHVGTDGKHLSMLFPNDEERDNKVAANTLVKIPRGQRSTVITAGGPPGVNRLVIMVSRVPRDFRETGWKKADLISEFDLGQVQKLWSTMPLNQAVIAGKPVCTDASHCNGSYGAALLEIHEVDR